MNSLLWEGVNLMAIGMGAVFSFLVLLVFATSAMSSLISRFLPEPELPITPAPSNGQQPSQADNGQLMAVIAAAIHRHRTRHK
jgi:oxaloacetate decarboxylase gamma subunit